MLEHSYIANLKIAQRYERMRREADVWRLLHQPRKDKQSRLSQRHYWVMDQLGQVLVALGRWLQAYGTS